MAAQRLAHQRLTPVGFVGAGILILTSALFPAADDPGDYDDFLALLAEYTARTRFVLLAVPIGILLLATAVVALRERVEDPVGRRWLHAALPAVLVGAAAVSVQFALANAALSERIDGASDGTVLWAAATYVRSFAMLSLWAGLAGVGWALLAGRSARSAPPRRAAPAWLAVTLIAVGLAMVLASGAAIVTGPQAALSLIVGGLAGITAIWAILLGVALARR